MQEKRISLRGILSKAKEKYVHSIRRIKIFVFIIKFKLSFHEHLCMIKKNIHLVLGIFADNR